MSGLESRLVVHRGDFTLDIELAIERTQTLALLGPNGSGKSTTVAALAGLVPLDDGAIVLDDRTLDSPATGVFVAPEDRNVGVVFQQYLLFEHLDVVDNVAFGPASRGASRRQARATAHEWLELLDLSDLAARRPGDLSGGQSQRVALARALATNPAALLLDEPLAALDVETRTRLRRTLRAHVADFAGPRLMITHDPSDAFLLADQIAVLEAGRIVQVGEPDAIRRAPATPYVAAIAGLNRLTGTTKAGVVCVDDHDHELQVADQSAEGPVLVTISPAAVALYRDQPHGSPRNSWSAPVATIEPLGDITRVTFEAPLPLSADVTPAAVSGLGLEVGSTIWLSVKATEIAVTPA